MPAREWKDRSRQRWQHPENIQKRLPRGKPKTCQEDYRTGNMIQGDPTELFIGKAGAQKELMAAPRREERPWDHLLK